MDDLTLDADLEHHLFKTNSRESRPICAAAYTLAQAALHYNQVFDALGEPIGEPFQMLAPFSTRR